MRAFILLTVLVATPAAAATDLALLDRASAIFAGAPLGAEGGPAAPIDRRLRLADCAQSPMFSWRTDRKDAIVIQCPDAGGWRIFVPIRPGAQAVAAAQPAKADPVIRRGDPVLLSANSEGFSVSSNGVAMSDAAPGARFTVRIEGMKTPVQAIATEAGQATLPGW
ncbi:MAG: hypothetical protein ABS87_05630 [Sphingomonas sp. SCN 67-18]|uniref:flagella basal body P-ring formation protein FlgA n=1 Tax=uncultured Sphingomonas sp. TaxID=158754 RepID=UPI0008699607|nr:flagella basal body P-ring formation protein FlgA [Sphingomonas sp. SCN 67-18]ODU21584.1 MAG: hypothetical protein ABS87_05630 [Sphingomonas sp. SCN 67-18]